MNKKFEQAIHYVCNKYGIRVYELKVSYRENLYMSGILLNVELNGIYQRRIFNEMYPLKKHYYKEAYRIVQVYTKWLNDKVNR